MESSRRRHRRHRHTPRAAAAPRCTPRAHWPTPSAGQSIARGGGSDAAQESRRHRHLFRSLTVVLRFEWNDENGSHSHDVEINVIDTRQVKADIYINSTGVDQTEIDVGLKTNFYAYSSLGVPVSVEQISGPVPKADETGYPAVNSFVITGDVHVLWDDEDQQVFQPMELLAWITLLILIIVFLSMHPSIYRSSIYV